jgi:hypothetical protein
VQRFYDAMTQRRWSTADSIKMLFYDRFFIFCCWIEEKIGKRLIERQ